MPMTCVSNICTSVLHQWCEWHRARQPVATMKTSCGHGPVQLKLVTQRRSASARTAASIFIMCVMSWPRRSRAHTQGAQPNTQLQHNQQQQQRTPHHHSPTQPAQQHSQTACYAPHACIGRMAPVPETPPSTSPRHF